MPSGCLLAAGQYCCLQKQVPCCFCHLPRAEDELLCDAVVLRAASVVWLRSKGDWCDT
jgi:hypothetical protein